MTSTICTIPPASAFMTPELAATATLRPCFWKNRMTSAVVAIVPPMSPVKLLANCSASTGPNGSGRLTAPMSATEPENWGTNESSERDDDPGPLRLGERRPEIDAGELGDDQVEAEERGRRHDDAARATPVAAR